AVLLVPAARRPRGWALLDGHRAVRGLRPAAPRRGPHHRRSHRRGAPGRRLRGAPRPAGAPEPRADRGTRTGAAAPDGRSAARLPGPARGHDAGGLVSADQPDRVGRVLGSQHSSTSEFRVVLDEEDYLQLDDLVVVGTQVPKAGEVRTYGVVTEAEAVYEGAAFESDTHRVAELGIMPAAKVRSARVSVTRVDPEVWVSPDPGEVA